MGQTSVVSALGARSGLVDADNSEHGSDRGATIRIELYGGDSGVVHRSTEFDGPCDRPIGEPDGCESPGSVLDDDGVDESGFAACGGGAVRGRDVGSAPALAEQVSVVIPTDELGAEGLVGRISTEELRERGPGDGRRD